MRIFNTLTRRLEKFEPSDSVRVMLCGPTVYDCSHIGHARTLLFYDLAARYFRSIAKRVSVVVNITDIDPKVFRKARETGERPHELATKLIRELSVDLRSLGIESFMLARVSDHVGTARDLIKSLLSVGRAYYAGGNIYLDTSSTPLGSLSKMSRRDLHDCRVDISPAKRQPTDILLWNASESFDVAFHDSELGSGIPWWHMQDSSVAMANFAGHYDIHGGAIELAYPHHESHLAQLQALTGEDQPVRFWTHAGLVRIKGNKMSKSTGNTVSVRDLLEKHGANAIRLYMYSRHYRETLDFAEKDIEKFDALDEKTYIAMSRDRSGRRLFGRFIARIEDDFDTPAAVRILAEAARCRSADINEMVSLLGLRY